MALDTGDERTASGRRFVALEVYAGPFEKSLQGVDRTVFVAGLFRAVVDACLADQLLEEFGGRVDEFGHGPP